MLYVFRISSPADASGAPASDLDGEEWTVTADDAPQARLRATRRLNETFRLASKERQLATTIAVVAMYPSAEAYRKAQVAA